MTFAAVGDVYLGGLVGEAIARHGVEHPFRYIGGVLRRYDLAFANLEAPITRAPGIDKSGPTWCVAPEMASALSLAGFGVLNLSNNHIGDCGNTGVVDTLAHLEAAGLHGFGVGRSAGEARAPLIVERRGVRVAFLGYCDSYLARGRTYGGAPIRAEIIVPDVRGARNRADCVVVSLHHGVEYSDHPQWRAVELARVLVDAGADVVLGHHPHVIQGWERHGRGVIVHSLGNFVADFGDVGCKRAAFERSILVLEGLLEPDLADTRTEEGLVFTCELTVAGVGEVCFIPIVINTEFQPVVAGGERATAVLERLEHISQDLRDRAMPVYADLERIGLKIALQRARPSLELLGRLHRVRPRHGKILVQYARALLRGRPA